MATVKSQQFVMWDTTTLANYKSLAVGIGVGMAAIGWTRLGSPTGSLVLTSVATASADSTSSTGACSVYTGTITGGGSNALVGLNFVIAGFSTSANNGTFTCVASSTTTLTLSNASGASETHAATASGDCGQVAWGNVSVLPAAATPTISQALNFRGAWVKNTAYAIGDIVNDGGNGYICNVAQAASIAATAVAQAGTVSTLTITNTTEATSNGWVGLNVNISGFVGTPANNGDFTITASTATSITYTNASGANETHAATLIFNSGPGTKHTGTTVHSNLAASAANNQWISWNFEIWTNSASSLYATNPIYAQFIYVNQSKPDILFRCGNIASTSTGMISGNTYNGWAAPNVVSLAGVSASSNQGSSLFELDICGDVSKFSMIPARTLSSGFLTVEYAKDSSGNDIDTYFFVAKSNVNTPQQSQVIFKAGSGSLNPQSTTGAAPSEIPSIFGTNTTASVNGLTPASPIFPNPGYIGNPILGAVCVRSGDAVEGELINVVLYGSSHTYLVTRANSTLIAGNNVLAMRWEVA